MKTKTILHIILLISFIACNAQTKDKTIDAETISKISSNADTLTINGQRFIETRKNNNFYCLTSLKGDTIIDAEDFYFKCEILDFNDDGYKDLRVFIYSNTANQCDNYLYDKDTKTFKQLQFCDLDFKKIPNKNYYFTYFKKGCAGQDFGSYLSKLEGNNFINLAYIEENGCDFDTINNPQNFKIYQVLETQKETLKLVKTYKYNDFEGIEEYWKLNCEKFDKK